MLPIIVALLFVIAPADPELVEIPLSEIWADNLEGTKQILRIDDQGLMPVQVYERLVLENAKQAALRAQADHTAGKEPVRKSSRSHAGPAIIINGDAKAALKYFLLMQGGIYQPHRSFDERSKLFLVVCTYGQPGFVLDKVERGGQRIKVSWHFPPEAKRDPRAPKRVLGGPEVGSANGSNLAIIPLGKLPPGDYDVDVIRTGEPKFGPDWWVSKSTSFQVTKAPEPKPDPIPGFAPNFSPKGTP